jgi:DNA-binding CsgD family transcriptional regulator
LAHPLAGKEQPRRPARKPKVATFETAQETPLIVLSDEEMRRNYEDAHPGELERMTNHVALVYRSARERRQYRQAHVMKNWDQTDRRVLFLLVLGYSHKRMQAELGISRQAIEKRVERMCQQVGVEEDTQLLLWILGFVTLHSDGTMTTTGTTLIEPHDFSTPFGRRILSSIRVPSLSSTKI